MASSTSCAGLRSLKAVGVVMGQYPGLLAVRFCIAGEHCGPRASYRADRAIRHGPLPRRFLQARDYARKEGGWRRAGVDLESGFFRLAGQLLQVDGVEALYFAAKVTTDGGAALFLKDRFQFLPTQREQCLFHALA